MIAAILNPVAWLAECARSRGLDARDAERRAAELGRHDVASVRLADDRVTREEYDAIRSAQRQAFAAGVGVSRSEPVGQTGQCAVVTLLSSAPERWLAEIRTPGIRGEPPCGGWVEEPRVLKTLRNLSDIRTTSELVPIVDAEFTAVRTPVLRGGRATLIPSSRRAT